MLITSNKEAASMKMEATHVTLTRRVLYRCCCRCWFLFGETAACSSSDVDCLNNFVVDLDANEAFMICICINLFTGGYHIYYLLHQHIIVIFLCIVTFGENTSGFRTNVRTDTLTRKVKECSSQLVIICKQLI